MTKKYMHQATSTSPIEQFSDAPCRVDGVTYKPKWPWSDSYRKCFRKTYGKIRSPEKVRLITMEHAYSDWLNAKNGGG